MTLIKFGCDRAITLSYYKLVGWIYANWVKSGFYMHIQPLI